MLTIQSEHRYTESLKTTNTAFTPRQRVFFMPMAWMRAGNTQYQPKHLLVAFSESTPLLILNGDLLRKTNKMTNAISVFKFNQNQVRTQSVDGNVWFCLIDCMDGLGLRNKSTKIRLAENGVCKTYLTDNLGRQQQTTFINEPNLYRLIFRSNKPQAQAFADWVYSEVLPSIRKTGSYGVPSLDAKAIVDEQELREAKNLLTTYFCYDYTESLKTSSGISAPDRLGEFFVPIFWRMRTVNISNSGQPLLGLSESATSQICVAFLKLVGPRMKELISYTFKNSQIRTTIIDNEPWFVATDVAQALEYRDSEHATRYLDDDERDTLNQGTPGKQLTIINESGLYSLILRSRKPEAKAFKKFVTSEVLPSIRKTGGYGVPTTLRQELAALTSESASDTNMQDMRNLVAALMNNIIDGRVKNQYRHLVDEITALRAKLDTIKKTIA